MIFFFVARSIWLAYIQKQYRLSMPSILLELKIPREVRRNPRAMEQILMGIHAIRNSPANFQDKWWDGEVTLTHSLEMVSFGGDIHLYIRIPKKHRHMIEAIFYSHYPDIEIVEAEDYVNRMPPTLDELEKSGYKLFGSELKLAKKDAYPIRTFMEFEEKEEERQLDPISVIFEMLAKIKPQEILWVQTIIRPTTDWWKEEGEKIIRELKEKAKTEITSSTGRITWTERTPGEMETMKVIERNITKPGFETLVRYIYMAPPDIYDANFGQRAVYSSFNQYATASLNKFVYNVKVWTRTKIWYWPFLFPARRLKERRILIYENYRKRRMYEELDAPIFSHLFKMRFFHWGIKAEQFGRMVLNTEEAATIFHLPMFIVLTGPIIKRVEARKVGPPAGLPIYGEEGDEELPGVKK